MAEDPSFLDYIRSEVGSIGKNPLPLFGETALGRTYQSQLSSMQPPQEDPEPPQYGAGRSGFFAALAAAAQGPEAVSRFSGQVRDSYQQRERVRAMNRTIREGFYDRKAAVQERAAAAEYNHMQLLRQAAERDGQRAFELRGILDAKIQEAKDRAEAATDKADQKRWEAEVREMERERHSLDKRYREIQTGNAEREAAIARGELVDPKEQRQIEREELREYAEVTAAVTSEVENIIDQVFNGKGVFNPTTGTLSIGPVTDPDSAAGAANALAHRIDVLGSGYKTLNPERFEILKAEMLSNFWKKYLTVEEDLPSNKKMRMRSEIKREKGETEEEYARRVEFIDQEVDNRIAAFVSKLAEKVGGDADAMLSTMPESLQLKFGRAAYSNGKVSSDLNGQERAWFMQYDLPLPGDPKSQGPRLLGNLGFESYSAPAFIGYMPKIDPRAMDKQPEFQAMSGAIRFVRPQYERALDLNQVVQVAQLLAQATSDIESYGPEETFNFVEDAKQSVMETILSEQAGKPVRMDD